MLGRPSGNGLPVPLSCSSSDAVAAGQPACTLQPALPQGARLGRVLWHGAEAKAEAATGFVTLNVPGAGRFVAELI